MRMTHRILATLAMPLFLAFGTSAWSMPTQANADRLRALASEHSPRIGPADAKVHIVEFLDPACEGCAAFYPELKKIMAAYPGRVRLSVRHVPFHRGAEPVARMLEAARAQDKYVPALEALLASQDRWTRGHVANADDALAILRGIGLDADRVKREMGDARDHAAPRAGHGGGQDDADLGHAGVLRERARASAPRAEGAGCADSRGDRGEVRPLRLDGGLHERRCCHDTHSHSAPPSIRASARRCGSR